MPSFVTLRLVAILALSTLAMPALSQPASPPATVITIKSFDFSPMTVRILAGGAVTWKNLDGEPHTVVSLDGTFRSVALDEGDSFTFKFTKPGTYSYLCSIHPQMRAQIVVK